MDRQTLKTLRTASRAITIAAGRIKKAIKVLVSLQGFTSPANGEMEAAARQELLHATDALKAQTRMILDCIDEIGEQVDGVDVAPDRRNQGYFKWSGSSRQFLWIS
jgi:hypothetical protein